jgi:predicted NACHT family NTPase
MNSGKFILLLDAFDELDEEVTKETFHEIERYSDKYEKLKIIVTSRPSSEIQKSTKFKIIRLAPLGEADYTPFLNKLGLGSVFIAELKTLLKIVQARYLSLSKHH